jgi:exonuclease VII small subunit
MDPKEYEKKIAKLESVNDQLTAEFAHLDAVLKKLGFEEGIITLKEAANEMLEKNPPEEPEDH